MRRIEINGYTVDILPSEVIEFTLRSGFLNFDKLEGSFTTSFKLPYKNSARNRIAMQFSGSPARLNRGVLVLSFSFFWRNVLKYKGTVEVSQVGADVECAATVENGDLIEKWNAYYIDEIGLGSFSLTAPTAYYSGDIVLPKMKNLRNRPDDKGWVNFWNGSSYRYNYTSLFVNYAAICPMWKWANAMQRILEHFGYNVIENDIDPEAVIASFFDILNTDFSVPSEVLKNKFLPHITVAQFISITQVNFGVFILIADNEVRIVERKSIISADASKSIKLADIDLTLKRTSYTFGYDADMDDRAYSPEAVNFAGHAFLPWADVAATNKKIIDVFLLLDGGGLSDEQKQTILSKSDLARDLLGQYYLFTQADDGTISYSLFSQFGAQQQAIANTCIRNKAIPVGYHATMLNFKQEMAVDFAGARYAKNNFSSIRWGRLVDNGTQHEIRSIEDYSVNPSAGWVLWAPSVLPGDFSLYSGTQPIKINTVWEETWGLVLQYLNEYAEEFESVFEGDGHEDFVNNLDFGCKYADSKGQNYIITEVVVAYTSDQMSKPKIKGLTAW